MNSNNTNSYVIEGRHARMYNIRQLFNGSSFIYAKMLKHVALKPNSKVLDVGCGTGTLLFILAQRYDTSIKFYGIDPSEDMIIIAEKKSIEKYAHVTFSVGEGERLPYDNQSFDYIVSSLTIHHLSHSKRREVVEEMHRVLKPGGQLFVTDFGPIRSIFGSFLALFLKNHAFVKDSLKHSIPELLKKFNFSKIKTLGVQFGLIEHVFAVK